MFQEDFGARLRELHLSKGLTKEEFCKGDEVLCVRQLTRLETGKSQPKLETLTLLAQRLEITVSELIGETETKLELPAEYQKLKYQLLRTPTYQNADIIADLEQSLEVIFLKYYDSLPEEEKEIVDILQSAIYTTELDGEYFGETILLKYKDRLESILSIILCKHSSRVIEC